MKNRYFRAVFIVVLIPSYLENTRENTINPYKLTKIEKVKKIGKIVQTVNRQIVSSEVKDYLVKLNEIGKIKFSVVYEFP